MPTTKYDITLIERRWIPRSTTIMNRNYLNLSRIVAADPQVEKFVPVGPFAARGGIWIGWRFLGKCQSTLFWYRQDSHRAVLRSASPRSSLQVRQVVSVAPLGHLCSEVTVARQLSLPLWYKPMVPLIRASQRRSIHMMLNQLTVELNWQPLAQNQAA